MQMKVRARGEGTLLPNEDTHIVQLQAEVQRLKDILHDREHAVERARRDRILSSKGVDLSDSAGAHVFLEKDVRDQAALLDTLPSLQLTSVPLDDILVARLFVASSINQLGLKATLAVALVGGSVLNPMYVQSHGSRGTCTTFFRAVNTVRLVWLSDRFRQTFPRASRIIRDAAALPRSKLRLFSSKDLLDAAVVKDRARPRRQRRPKESLGLVSDAEKASLYSQVDHMLTLAQFVELCKRRDHSKCSSGMCGS